MCTHTQIWGKWVCACVWERESWKIFSVTLLPVLFFYTSLHRLAEQTFCWTDPMQYSSHQWHLQQSIQNKENTVHMTTHCLNNSSRLAFSSEFIAKSLIFQMALVLRSQNVSYYCYYYNIRNILIHSRYCKHEQVSKVKKSVPAQNWDFLLQAAGVKCCNNNVRAAKMSLLKSTFIIPLRHKHF